MISITKAEAHTDEKRVDMERMVAEEAGQDVRGAAPDSLAAADRVQQGLAAEEEGRLTPR
jgi:hypothetical protein